MTREELDAITGSTAQTDLVIDLLLKQVKPAFIRSIVRAEAVEVNKQLLTLTKEGWACWTNGHIDANWGQAEKLNGLRLTPEQEAAYEAAADKCCEVERLSYYRNRLTSLEARI